MFGCLRWCFGGRPDDEAAKYHENFAANLEADHQQILRGIAARLATADAAERIRIRDMLRDGDERWFPSADEKRGTMEWEEEEEGEKKAKETMMEKNRGRKKKRPEDEGEDEDDSSSSNKTTGSSRAPQLCCLSPPPMTADLRPVLTDLPEVVG